MQHFRAGSALARAVAAAGLVLLSIVASTCAPAHANTGFDDPVGATELLVLANLERTAAGLALLEARGDAYEVAVEHSRRMAVVGEIFHNDGYFTSEMRQRLGAKVLGENVARNQSVADAHRRLMASPGHRANLLDPRFTVVGMAVVRSADGTGFVTQSFLQPAGRQTSTSVAAAPTPPAATTPSPIQAPSPREPEPPAPTPRSVVAPAPVDAPPPPTLSGGAEPATLSAGPAPTAPPTDPSPTAPAQADVAVGSAASELGGRSPTSSLRPSHDVASPSMSDSGATWHTAPTLLVEVVAVALLFGVVASALRIRRHSST